jgi:hypothetical protein
VIYDLAKELVTGHDDVATVARQHWAARRSASIRSEPRS